jgi:hypothetical protein
MSVVPGPASQDAILKLTLASPALQCTGGFIKPPGEYAQISSRKSVENSKAF